MGFLTYDELCLNFGIALTGGIGAGKTTVSKLLEKLGYPIISADTLARKIVQPDTEGYKKIVEIFGTIILDEHSQINRKTLREIVFNDEKLRVQLEAITHPLIQRELHRELEVLGLHVKPRIWFYEAPVIVEAGRQKKFRELWLLVCPKSIRMERIMKRDATDELNARQILSAQLSDQEKSRFARVIIDASQDLKSIHYALTFHLERLNKPI